MSKLEVFFYDKLLLAVVVFASIFFALNNLGGHTPLHIDSALFSTAVINMASGEGLIFDSYTYYLNIAGNKFDFHGPLYPWLFGLVFNVDSYEKLFLAHGILAAFTTLSAFLAFRSHPTIDATTKVTSRLLAAAILAIYAGYVSVNLQGRPESVAMPMICFSYFLMKYDDMSRRQLFVLFVLATLIFLCSPLLGLLHSAIVMARIAWQRTPTAALGIALIFGALAIALIAMFLVVVGSDLVTWLSRTWNVGGSGSQRDWLRLFVFPSISNMPATNLLSLMAFAVVLSRIFRQRRWILLPIVIPASYLLIPNANSYIYQAILPVVVFHILDQSRKTQKYFPIQV